MAAIEIKAKRKCCKSGPRCRRCPVVLERLEAAGYAERITVRRFTLAAKPPKKVLKRARKRGKRPAPPPQIVPAAG